SSNADAAFPAGNVVKVDVPVASGQPPGAALGPFDQHDAAVAKQVFQTEIKYFLTVAETVQIKVMDVQAANAVAFYEPVAGAFDPAIKTHRAQQAAHQGGFPHAQIARQVHHLPAAQQFGQSGAGRQRVGFAGRFDDHGFIHLGSIVPSLSMTWLASTWRRSRAAESPAIAWATTPQRAASGSVSP